MRNLETPVDGQEVQDVLEILEEVLMEEEELKGEVAKLYLHLFAGYQISSIVILLLLRLIILKNLIPNVVKLMNHLEAL